MVTYTPPGWPAGVHPPGSDDFESTAVGWLLDVVPPDYRLHGVLRRYPVALATMARHHSRACVEGARQGYRTARTELAGTLPPHAVDTVLAAYRKEGARLAATARAVGLVERALRGEVFTPGMGDPKPAEPPFEPQPTVTQPTVAQPTETRQTESRQAEPRQAGPRQAEPRQAGPRQAGPKPTRPQITEPKPTTPDAGSPKAGTPRAKAGEPKPSGRPVAARVGAGPAEAPRGEELRADVPRAEAKRAARQRKAT
jgi:hypothetical protein